jgi:nicotinamide-nucleotide amidase
MRIEVINTGSELLLGKVINTHAAFFGQELFKIGLRVERQTTIPDGDVIGTMMKEAFGRCDALLVTGGLGPTSDDITREVAATLLRRELVLDEAILETIRTMFRVRGLTASSLNDRQAMVPVGATVLVNPHGTAPGLYIPADPELGSPHIFLLPGPPRELKPMVLTEVLPRLATISGGSAPVWHNFRFYGVGESALAAALETGFAGIDGLEVGYCARLGEVDLRLIGSKMAVDRAAELVRAAFPVEIATESEDSLSSVVVALLKSRGETVATAESCTGGAISSAITDAPGSSAVFGESYIVYANAAKTKLVGVAPERLAEHGAVSEEVVRAMAEGCLKRSGADHAIAVSGVAGPDGGSAEKPVGTVWLAIASRGQETFAQRYFYPLDRASFKIRTTRQALDLLRRRLRGFALA